MLFTILATCCDMLIVDTVMIAAYMSVFKPIIQDVVAFYQPTVIVLQVNGTAVYISMLLSSLPV